MLSDFSEDCSVILSGLNTFSGSAEIGPQFRVQLQSDEGSLVAGLSTSLAQLIDDNPVVLPDEVKENDFFSIIFGGQSLNRRLGHRQLLVPVAPNETTVHQVIGSIAQRIETFLLPLELTTTIEGLREKIKSILTHHLRRRLVTIFKEAKFHMEEGGSFTPAEVEAAFNEVQELVNRGKISPEKASSAVLYKLGAISKEEIVKRPTFIARPRLTLHTRERDNPEATKRSPSTWDELTQLEDIERYDVSSFETEIKDSLHWASDFIRDRMLEVKSLLRHYEAEGLIHEEENEAPNLNQSLRNKTPFEILDYLYTGDEIRDVNDAQILWVVGFIHFMQARRIQRIEAVNKVSHIDKNVLASMFGDALPNGKIKYPTLKFRDGKFTATGSAGVLSCRSLQTTAKVKEHQKMVHLVEVDDKQDKSRFYKYFARAYGEVGPDRFPDEIRTRGILAGITSQELENDATLQNMVIENLTACAHSLGMTVDRSDEVNSGQIDPIQLEPRQFAIEKDFSHPRYPKISMLGVTEEGVRVEIQLITIDTYAFEEADGSGMHHDVKEAQLKFKMAKDLAPQTISPVTHRVCNWKLKEIEAHQAQTATARTDFIVNNSDFFALKVA